MEGPGPRVSEDPACSSVCLFPTESDRGPREFIMPTVCRQMGESLGPLPCCQASETVGLYKNRATLSPLETSPSVLGLQRLHCLHAQLQGRTQSPERLGGGWGLFPPWQVRARASRTAPLRSQGEALEAQSWRPRRASSVDALSALHKMGGQMLSQFFLFGKLIIC